MGWDRVAVTAGAPVNVNVVSSVPIDVTDRVGRLLGIISGAVGITGQPISVSIAGQPISVDVIDKVARLLGHVQIDTPDGQTVGGMQKDGTQTLLTTDPRLRDLLEIILGEIRKD